MQQSKKYRAQLFWLLAAFLVPVMISTGLYYFRAFIHFHTTNRGTLVSAPFDVQYLYADLKDGNKPLWRMMYVNNGKCDAHCQQVTYQLNQIKKAMGKATDRVDVMVINAHDAGVQKMQAAMNAASNMPVTIHNRIYLIDPNGNCFMVYAEDVDPMDVLKDLKKVLEVSQIG